MFFVQYFLLLQYIVSSGKDSRVYLWELSTGKKFQNDKLLLVSILFCFLLGLYLTP